MKIIEIDYCGDIEYITGNWMRTINTDSKTGIILPGSSFESMQLFILTEIFEQYKVDFKGDFILNFKGERQTIIDDIYHNGKELKIYKTAFKISDGFLREFKELNHIELFATHMVAISVEEFRKYKIENILNSLESEVR